MSLVNQGGLVDIEFGETDVKRVIRNSGELLHHKVFRVEGSQLSIVDEPGDELERKFTCDWIIS